MSLSGLLPLLYDRREYGALARSLAGGEGAFAEAPLDAARPYVPSFRFFLDVLGFLIDDALGQGREPLVRQFKFGLEMVPRMATQRAYVSILP